MRENTRWLFALIVAIAMIATACGGSEGGDQATLDETADEVLDTSEESAEEDTPAEPEEAQEEVESEESASDPQPTQDLIYNGSAELLTAQFEPVDPGEYRVDTLGTRFSLTIADGWFVQPNEDAFIAFSHPDSQGPGDRDIALLRPSHLAEPERPWAPADEQDGQSVDEISIEEWLGRLADGILIEEPEQTTVGGYSAVTFQVETTPSKCGLQFCVGFATNRLINSIAFEPNIRYTVYWVDQGDEAPIAIVTGRADEGFGQMIDELLGTIAFDEPAPDPIVVAEGQPLWEAGFSADVPAGVHRFPTFGGLELELDTERYMPQPTDNWLVLTDGPVPADVEIWLAHSRMDGTAIATTDDLIAALGDLDIDATITESGEADLPLGTARIFDLEHDARPEVMTQNTIRTQEGGGDWRPPVRARLWVVETERGVIVISAEAFFLDAADLLPRMIEIAEAVAPTITLTDGVSGPALSSDGSEQAAGETLPEPGPLAAGTYSTDALGTTVTFSTTTDLNVVFNEPGLVLLEDPNKVGQFSEALVLMRSTGLAAGDEATAVPPADTFAGAGGDISGWLDTTDGIELVGQEVNVVAGNEVDAYTIQLATGFDATIPDGCGPTADDRCYFTASTTSGTVPHVIMRTTEVYRHWVVDDRVDPPVMALAIAHQSNVEWLDDITPVVESLEFGTASAPLETEVAEAPEGGGLLDESFVPLGPGTFTVESLGIPLSFTTVDDSWFVQPNDPAFLVLTDPESVGPHDRDIVFLRVAGLTHPDDMELPIAELAERPSWPLGDLVGWIDALPSTIAVSNVTDTEFGGRSAVAFDVTVDDAHACGPEVCVPFVGALGTTGKSFRPGVPFKVFWVDGGAEAPLAVVVGGGQDAPDAFFAAAAELIATIELGEPGPHPGEG